MKVRLRGMNGGFGGGGAPRPSGAGSTRKPDGCGVVGGAFGAVAFSALGSAGGSGAKVPMYWPPASPREGHGRAQPARSRTVPNAVIPTPSTTASGATTTGQRVRTLSLVRFRNPDARPPITAQTIEMPISGRT